MLEIYCIGFGEECLASALVLADKSRASNLLTDLPWNFQSILPPLELLVLDDHVGRDDDRVASPGSHVALSHYQPMLPCSPTHATQSLC